jgi:hypothetical protein
LDAALAEELTKSLESLGNHIVTLSEKFANDYTPLAAKLQKVVEISGNL